ncbi:hypothetical protein GY45DRAFT_1438716 [Cubamyces sp. BRFM 1775]|nr:hypothetical protein GY45DRAFT_1438716 [Cubamyces sp. BRFM 1775]
MPTNPRTALGECESLGANLSPFDDVYYVWMTGGAGAGTIARPRVAACIVAGGHPCSKYDELAAVQGDGDGSDAAPAVVQPEPNGERVQRLVKHKRQRAGGDGHRGLYVPGQISAAGCLPAAR